MLFAFNFDLTNAGHAQALAVIAQTAAEAGVPMQAITTTVGGATPAQKAQAPDPQPKAEPKQIVLPEATDHKVVVKRLDDEHVVFAEYAGGALGKARKAILKAAGFEWDAEHPTGEVYKRATADHQIGDPKLGAWKGTPEAFTKLFGKAKKQVTITVTKAQIEEQRAKAQARAERKARKSA